MSKINFRLLVEQLLHEEVINLFMPQGVSRPDETLAAITTFTKNLHSGGQKYLGKDFLISNKPYWPYADTLEYITLEVNKALPKFAADFDTQLTAVVEALKRLNVNTAQIGNALLQALKGNRQLAPDEISKMTDIAQRISDKVQILEKNRTNYRSYSNPRLAQSNDETSVLAAEPYLSKTPKDAVISVLRDFGGYDQALATKIIKYPAEAKYTQRAENIDNLVMKSIIEISKLTLIFYREKIQTFGPQILDLFNYGEFQDAISRAFMVNQDQINSALAAAGTQKGDQAKVSQILNKIITAIGLERPISPSQTLEKIFYDDYMHFIDGKSSLVLNEEVYSKPELLTTTNLSQYSLIKKIQDFDSQPGKGHSIYEAYLYLFNNMRKGEIPTIWNNALARLDSLSQAASTLFNISGQKLMP
jgi:hypothetical protein